MEPPRDDVGFRVPGGDALGKVSAPRVCDDRQVVTRQDDGVREGEVVVVPVALRRDVVHEGEAPRGRVHDEVPPAYRWPHI